MPWILLTRLSLAQCPDFTEDRQVFFGDLHVHTHLSLDASAQGTRITPDEAYAFAQGEPLEIRGETVQIQPLDFVALTDHSEFLGEQALCTNPDSERYTHPLCWLHRRHESLAFLLFHMQLARPWFGDPNEKEVPRKGLCGRGDIHCRLAAVGQEYCCRSCGFKPLSPCHHKRARHGRASFASGSDSPYPMSYELGSRGEASTLRSTQASCPDADA